MFGVLAVGIWGVDGLGLLHGGGLTQLGIQAIGLVAATAWTLPLAFLMFYAINKTIGLRVSETVEEEGIDLEYHGIGSYPEFIENGSKKQPVSLPGDILPSPTD
ncbi:MAG: hypothetical protein P8183_08545 [Anaerolineae bacterium]